MEGPSKFHLNSLLLQTQQNLRDPFKLKTPGSSNKHNLEEMHHRLKKESVAIADKTRNYVIRYGEAVIVEVVVSIFFPRQKKREEVGRM